MSWPHVPKFRLILRSENVPLTGMQAEIVAVSLLRKGFTGYPSRMELTFDVSRFPVSYFRQHLFTRAQRLKTLRDSVGRETFYVGGPASPWQLCVYEKTDSIVRVEFKFRREFLRLLGIEDTPNLLRLQKFNLTDLVSFKDFREDRLQSALDRTPEIQSEFPRRWPLRDLERFLRWLLGIAPLALLRTSDAERLLQHMQSNLIW